MPMPLNLPSTPLISALAATVAAALMTNGCTLASLNSDVHAREARIADEQNQLDAENARQDELHAEMLSLSADLDQKNLSLVELQTRLTQIQQHNARVAASNAAQLARKHKIDQQISAYRAQLNALSQNQGMSVAEKQKKSQALQQQINQALKLMLLS